MNNKRYKLSVGHNETHQLHCIINENAYKNESEVVAEFSDYDMCTKFIDTCFIPIQNKKGEYEYSIYKQ